MQGLLIRRISSDSNCIECGSKYVVNKKYKLCEKHNRERLQLHKLPVQEKEEKQSSTIRRQFKVKDNRYGIDDSQKNIKRKSRSIPKRSTSTYRCSNGERVTQVEIDKRYKEICDQIDLERERYCEATGRTDLPLSHSHTISRKRCKELGKTELVWNKDNLFLESMGSSDSGHVIWEHGDLDSKKKLFNFERKLAYIKIHDQEAYQKIINEL